MRRMSLIPAALSLLAVAVLAGPAVAATPESDPLTDFAVLHAKLVQMEAVAVKSAGDDSKLVALLSRLISADSRAELMVRAYQVKAARRLP